MTEEYTKPGPLTLEELRRVRDEPMFAAMQKDVAECLKRHGINMRDNGLYQKLFAELDSTEGLRALILMLESRLDAVEAQLAEMKERK